MMYYMKTSLDPKIIGADHPHIQEYDRHDNVPIDYSIYDIEGKISQDYRIRRVIVKNRTKITDLLSSSPLSNFLLLSKNVLNILCNFNIAAHQLFDFAFLYKKNIYDTHRALWWVKDRAYLDYIDWDKSTFYKSKGCGEPRLEEYKFTSWNELIEYNKQIRDREKDYGLEYCLKIKYNEPFDLIRFSYPGFPFGEICTERVKKMIEEEGFTGFRFEPVEEDYFV